MLFEMTPFVRNLLIVNAVIHFGGQLLGLQDVIWEYFALYPFASAHFLPFQVFTHLFLHADFWHLFGNMFTLLVFGPKLEQVWGARRFAFFYFFCGLGAALLHEGVDAWELGQIRKDATVYLQHPTPLGFTDFVKKHKSYYYESDDFYTLSNRFAETPDDPATLKETNQEVVTAYGELVNRRLLGASGAIFGVLMAFGLLFPRTILLLGFFFPIQARFLVLLFGGMELYRIFQQDAGDNVAHFAHLGGMLFAYLLIRIWKTRRDTFY